MLYQYLVFVGGYEDSPDTSLWGWGSFRGKFADFQSALTFVEDYRKKLHFPDCAFAQIVEVSTFKVVWKDFWPKR